jgi:UDP-N-acetylmuramate dehydrogenase
MDIRENVPLAPFTTFKIGGPARFFVEAKSESDVIESLTYARSNRLPFFVLGGGSNVVVADSGFPGLVLKIALTGIEEDFSNGKHNFRVAAGEEWDAFVAASVYKGCGGIENLSGIPGTVGGTPVQNVGAYGQEVSETITSVRVLDRESLEFRELRKDECGFQYRTSIFNTTQREKFVVLGVTFALTPGGIPDLGYVDLRNHFLGREAPPSLAEVREAVRQIRLSKAMLIVPGDDDCRSAGSFFKNPIVSLKQHATVLAVAEDRGISRKPPSYPAGDGTVKLSAAWLVENSGFSKGFSLGPAAISRKHTLAIVNRGNACATDILALKERVQRGVFDTFGIELHPEPVMVGFERAATL